MSTLPPATTVDHWLRTAQAHGLDRLDAQLLLGRAVQQGRSWLLSHGDAVLPEAMVAALKVQCERRVQGEPLAYILGDQEFHGLPLKVSPAVLIPRPDTETLVDWALSLDAQTVLDLGTGSGAIALAIQHRRQQAQVWAVDASPAALDVARTNAQTLDLGVHFVEGNWLAPVAGQRFELIVSNPPYIAEGDAHLPALRHEPRSALTSGLDGLDDLRHIVANAPRHLQAGGWLLLEHGFDQGPAVADLLSHAGFEAVQHRHDLGGHVRCTGGRWPA